jgi:serine/threonine-protein kinase HipA
MTTLVALLNGVRVGVVSRRANGRVDFEYDAQWVRRPESSWLSLSMPASASRHSNDVVAPYLWGLLPDNPQVIERWGREFRVSAGNVFDLIANVGEDCAGAVQFVAPERIESLLGETRRVVDWLDEAQVAERLRDLRRDASTWRRALDRGRFSLAGAQPKTALLLEDGRFGIPSGRTPTTHILKPATEDLFEGHVENEHFCLRLAGRLGLPVARSEIRRFRDEVAIVVERYDRQIVEENRRSRNIVRVHQEDLCQALGVHPTRKYQSEGGPSPESCIALLRAHSLRPEEDVRSFMDAQIFNWLIFGTDGHAKNYSLLHWVGGRVRLAPLYDVASVLPYPGVDRLRAKLAMKVGGKYRLRDIGRHSWSKFARENKLNEEEVRLAVETMTRRLPDEALSLASELRKAELRHPILRKLVEALVSRSASIRREFGMAS